MTEDTIADESLDAYAKRLERTIHFLEEMEWPEVLAHRGKNGRLSFFILAPDFFFWGFDDAEEFTPTDFEAIKQATSDVEAQGGDSKWGPLLWVARKRAMRPQGAFYEGSGYEGTGGIPAILRHLFNACGEHRPAGIGNPYPTPDNLPDTKPS